MRATAIVPAAGFGLRMGRKGAVRKPFFVIKDKPILIHTLLALSRSDRISDIVVAVHKDDVKKCRDMIRLFKVKKVIRIIAGGRTRFESVKKGLSCVPHASDVVVIHDGVRPFVDEKNISDSIDACARCGAAVCGVPVVSTVKSVADDLTVKSTPDRSKLFFIQTPQVFRKAILQKAYRLPVKDTSRITDDSMLVERLGQRVKIAKGSYRNIKVTMPEDLIIAKALMDL